MIHIRYYFIIRVPVSCVDLHVAANFYVAGTVWTSCLWAASKHIHYKTTTTYNTHTRMRKATHVYR